MTINYPTSLDTLTNPAPTDQENVVSHSEQHSNANDAIEALEAKVGINGSAVTTSHDYKLSGVTGSDKAVSKTGTETLTNKTLTSPTINTASINGGTISSVTTSGTNTIGGTNTFSGTNTFTGTTTFNTSLPTSSQTPTNGSDLTTKTYVDNQALPSQTGNSGKFITTNGSTASWATIYGQVFKSGLTTRAGNTASGTQTIAHGLGRIPSIIKITVSYHSTGGGEVISHGIYDGTNNNCVYTVGYDTGNGIVMGSSGSSSSKCIYVPRIQSGSTGKQQASASFDATNITLNWTLTDTMASNNMNILWEAIA